MKIWENNKYNQNLFKEMYSEKQLISFRVCNWLTSLESCHVACGYTTEFLYCLIPWDTT